MIFLHTDQEVEEEQQIPQQVVVVGAVVGGQAPQMVQQPLVLEPIIEEERVAYFVEEYAALVGDSRRPEPGELRGTVPFFSSFPPSLLRMQILIVFL